MVSLCDTAEHQVGTVAYRAAALEGAELRSSPFVEAVLEAKLILAEYSMHAAVGGPTQDWASNEACALSRFWAKMNNTLPADERSRMLGITGAS